MEVGELIAVETRSNLLWSGENPIILLKQAAGEVETTAVGFFRVDFSPVGSGHAVFIISDLSPRANEKGVFVCYSDKEELGRWIRDTTIGTLPEFKNHDLRKIEIKPGRFAVMGNTLSSWTEVISTAEDEVRLTWGDLRQPFNLRVPVGAVSSIPYEINTVIYPAGRAEVDINGQKAGGKVFPDKIGNQESSTAFLALSETWYR